MQILVLAPAVRHTLHPSPPRRSSTTRAPHTATLAPTTTRYLHNDNALQSKQTTIAAFAGLPSTMSDPSQDIAARRAHVAEQIKKLERTIESSSGNRTSEVVDLTADNIVDLTGPAPSKSVGSRFSVTGRHDFDTPPPKPTPPASNPHGRGYTAKKSTPKKVKKASSKKAKKSTPKPAPRGCGKPGCTGSAFSDITFKCVECRDVVCCGRYEECCSCDAVMHAECAPGDDLCSNCNGGGSRSMGGWY